MTNFLSSAKQSLTDTLAEIPVAIKAYTIVMPLLTAQAAATRTIENYFSISHSLSNSLTTVVLVVTSLNVIVGAAAVNHYINHGTKVHFDCCERRYCIGRFAKMLERILKLENGAENGR